MARFQRFRSYGRRFGSRASGWARRGRSWGRSVRKRSTGMMSGLLKPKNMAMIAVALIVCMVWLNWSGIKQAWQTRGLLGSGSNA